MIGETNQKKITQLVLKLMYCKYSCVWVFFLANDRLFAIFLGLPAPVETLRSCYIIGILYIEEQPQKYQQEKICYFKCGLALKKHVVR